MTTAISSKLLNMSRKVTPVGQHAKHNTQHTTHNTLLLHRSKPLRMVGFFIFHLRQPLQTGLNQLMIFLHLCPAYVALLAQKALQKNTTIASSCARKRQRLPSSTSRLAKLISWGTDVRRPWLCSSTPPNPLFLWRSGISTTGLAWYC